MAVTRYCMPCGSITPGEDLAMPSHINRRPTCRHCFAKLYPGVAIGQTYKQGLPDFPGDSRGQTLHTGGPGKLIDVLKCPQCGYSVTESP